MDSATTSAPTFARPRRTARFAAIALVGLAPLTNCMCANAQRSRAYHRELHSEIDRYVHEGSRATVAEQARALVDDRGHALPGWDGRAPTTTAWETGDEERTRHHLELAERSGGFAVRLTEEVQHKAPPTWVRQSHRRDRELEHAVLRRIHPGRTGGTAGEGEHVYDVAPSVIWEATQEELLARGELLEQHLVPIDATAQTQWVVYDGDDPSRVRHEVGIVRISDAAHRLEVHRTQERGEGPRPWKTARERRDYDLELTLIERRDSAAAERMVAEARRKGDEAFERALDAGAIACGR